ncbi:hypothetical protein B7494_g8632 [Chlorociboria aeruginascens]|nr:hypothetical protein B7494_g8632 [Chlorociboria aeruginascens]
MMADPLRTSEITVYGPSTRKDLPWEMPLITNVIPLDDEAAEASLVTHSKENDYHDFEEYEDDVLDSDMEGSILHHLRVKRISQTPAVPPRSDKRTSRILDHVVLELNNVETSKRTDLEPQSMSDPHELYLSSEEDASFSDDYEDSLIEFDSSNTNSDERAASSRASSRGSQEDTARVVSFKLAGRPQIVHIPNSATNSPSSPQTRHPLEDTTPTSSPKHRRPSPLRLTQSSIHRLSISSSITSISTHNSSLYTQTQPLPSTRKSGKMAANFTHLTSLVTKHSHSFLTSDPFSATPSTPNETPILGPSSATPTPSTDGTPKTPTGLGWKRGFNSRLNKVVTKRPSMPKLNLAYTSGSNPSKTNLSLQPLRPRSIANEEAPRMGVRRSVTLPVGEAESSKEPKTPGGGPLRYEDIMRGVIKAPPVPSSAVERSSGGILGMGRRKSMKTRIY